MRLLKILGILVFVVLALVLLVSVILPTDQELRRSIVINAPPAKVYEQLASLENFNKWSVWNQRDSAAKVTLSGVDGTIGASSSWVGDPNTSGRGKIDIVALVPGKKINHTIQFTAPRNGSGKSEFEIDSVSGGTKLTWEFKLSTPRPKNIFNLFYNLDKKMGKDFEEGLSMMKTGIEMANHSPAAKTYEVKTMNYPSTQFAMVRQEIKQSDIANFFAEHLQVVKQELEKNQVAPGIPQGLYFLLDDKMQVTDMAAAFSVPEGTKLDNPIVRVSTIPASKALYVDYYGPYTGLMDVHNSIRKYIRNNSLKQKPPMIEQYLNDPVLEKDPAKWHTKVIFLVE